MITGATKPGSDYFLDGLNSIRNKEALTERQISSGYRIQTAADSPTEITDLVRLNGQLAANQTQTQNFGRLSTELQSADQGISTVISAVESAKTLGLQGGTATSTADSRQAIAAQVQGLISQVVGVANTSVEGRYIFAGDSDTVTPYQSDSSSAFGYSYQGAASSTRQVLDGTGHSLYAAATAQQLFDHRDTSGQPDASSVLTGLQNLVTALQSNTGIDTAVSSLETASTYLNGQLSQVGTSEQELTAAQNLAATQKTDLQTALSGIRDTDISQAAIDLNTEKVAESAAVAAEGGGSQKTLFDYLG